MKILIFLSIVFIPISAMAMLGNLFGNTALFDVEARKKQLQTPEFASIKQACMADESMISVATDKKLSQPDDEMPAPVDGLKSTDGYGSDKSLSDFSWYLMIHSGRALAGDTASETRVINALKTWASANALHKTEVEHDAYYALKRGLLPIINSYLIVQKSLSSDDKKLIEAWIDPLVRGVDHQFDGDVDHNNHRYLADSVLTLWGSVIDDKDLYAKGRERFEIAIDQMRADGSLPLETRRGSRALWYMRQSLANLTFITEIYAQKGDDLYGYTKDGKSLELMMNYFINATRNPLLVLEDSSENYIPGPSDNFLEQDMGTFERRGGRRHYMAFSHIYLNHFDENNISAQRLKALMDETGFQELPLIDDYIGGNATCVWGQP